MINNTRWSESVSRFSVIFLYVHGRPSIACSAVNYWAELRYKWKLSCRLTNIIQVGSPVITMQSVSEIRSHGVHGEGTDFGSLWFIDLNQDCTITKQHISDGCLAQFKEPCHCNHSLIDAPSSTLHHRAVKNINHGCCKNLKTCSGVAI